MSLRNVGRSARNTTWFCPGCRKISRDLPPSGLCAHCGDRLVERGYCPVCEDFWPLAAGSLCPKHDVELESLEEAQASAGDSAGSRGSWVEVARFSDALACQPPRIRLEAEGIPTVIDNERMGGRFMYHVATGGVGLRVPEELAAEARIILSQTWSATAKALDVDDWDDLGDEEVFAGENNAPGAPSFARRLGTAALRAAFHALLPWILAICAVLIVGLAWVLTWLSSLIGLN